MKITQDMFAAGEITLHLEYGTMQAMITFVDPGIGMRPGGGAVPARDAATELLKDLAKSINEQVPTRVHWVGI